MNLNYIMAATLVIMAAIIGLWDVYTYAVDRPRESVSLVFYEWSRLYPIFPFLLGVLVGHLFWPLVTFKTPG